jgi:5-formyltetrahydrofolate cyclo-ligase
MRSRRAATTPAERIAAGEALAAQLAGLPGFDAAARIAGYVAVGGELPLAHVAQACLARGQQWFLPTLVGESGLMRFARWHPGTPMAPNRYAIPEPVVPADELLEARDLDVVLVPLVAFDRLGQRLGSGGGFYDRTFAFLGGRRRPDRPLLVGIGWAFQEAELAAEPWDIAVDWIATERELIQCHA